MTEATPGPEDAGEMVEPSAGAPVMREHGCIAHGLVWLVAGSALVVLMAGVTMGCFWLSRLGG